MLDIEKQLEEEIEAQGEEIKQLDCGEEKYLRAQTGWHKNMDKLMEIQKQKVESSKPEETKPESTLYEKLHVDSWIGPVLAFAGVVVTSLTYIHGINKTWEKAVQEQEIPPRDVVNELNKIKLK